jgi:RHS repeat-associated protein
MSYAYNLAGALTSQTYPSGRVVTNTFDADGQLANVSSKSNPTATPRTYANSFIYNAAGAIQSMRLGNGRFESTVFNSRLQPTQIALGTSASNTSLLKLDYDYGSTDNNGNVKSQIITVPNMTYPLIQTYSYDSLNRLTSAEEKSNNITQWKQTFNFDRYGNRNFDEANTTTLPKNCGTPQAPEVCPEDRNRLNPSINTSDNRFSTGQGYDYDSSGNVTKDATDKRFIYDAENKQKSFGTNIEANNGGLYYYDGDGQRVKKFVAATNETTIFVYNAAGQLVAEYSTTAVQNPTISYLTTDTLGSPRINTNASGQVTARHDYLPFGEEIIGLGERATQQGYSVPDGVRQQFTQKERDNETGLDYFLARYYSSRLGRFTSPDQPFLDQYGSDAQSWNLYSYVGNKPLKYIDPLGQWKQVPCSGGASNCWEWEPSDDYDTLAKATGLSAKDLRDFFSNQAFGDGTVVDISNFANRNESERSLNIFQTDLRIAIRQSVADPSAIIPGGIIVNRGGGAVSRFFRWLGFGRKAKTFAGGITYEALALAAADTGPTIQVVTKLTQAPQAGRALSVAVGDGAEALANVARVDGQVYIAKIPKALIEQLRSAGLLRESVTNMGGRQAIEYRFEPQAIEFILPFFQ